MTTRRKDTPVTAAITLPKCVECSALRGDPCRTPSGKTRFPHDERKVTKRPPAWTKTVNPQSFASCDANGGQETMIHVYWSALGDARDAREGNNGHRMQRDRVSASLGLDRAPDPGFTPDEMQTIARAAKMAAIKCLGERARRGR